MAGGRAMHIGWVGFFKSEIVTDGLRETVAVRWPNLDIKVSNIFFPLTVTYKQTRFL